MDDKQLARFVDKELSRMGQPDKNLESRIAQMNGSITIRATKGHKIRNWLGWPVKRPRTEDVIDVMRVCSVHDRPFAARYIINDDGVYRHQGTIRITERLYRLQYQRHAGTALVPACYVVEEECPWCGARSPEEIFCTYCLSYVCWGRYGFGRADSDRSSVLAKGACRESCGYRGGLVNGRHTPFYGVHPQLRDGE